MIQNKQRKPTVRGNKNSPNQKNQGVAVSYVSENSTQSAPLFSNTSKEGDMRIRVRFREYLQDINGSVSFAVTSIKINPGLVASFPWLSRIASNFESYFFHKLAFEYRTLSSTATAGKVMLAVDYDVLDNTPNSKTEMLQNRCKVDGPAWGSFIMKLDAQDLRKFGPQRFIRDSVPPVLSDLKTYDIGQLLVGTASEANTNPIGELYVDYDVELMTPQSSPLAQLDASYKSTNTVSLSSANVFGNTQTWVPSTPTVYSLSANIVTVGPGQQALFELTLAGTTISAIGATNNTMTGLTTITGLINSAGTQAKLTVIAQNASSVSQTFTVTCTAATIGTSILRIAPYLFANG